MALETLQSAVAKILRAEGFTVHESDGSVQAARGSMELRIAVPPPGEDLMQALVSHCEANQGGDAYIVLVPSSTPDEEVLHTASVKGVLIWSKDEVEEERGISILRKYIKEPPSGLLRRISHGEGRPQVIELSSGPVSPESPSAPSPVREMYLPVNMDIEHVKELADKNINGYSFNLEMVPYFVFKASCLAQATFIAVNALDGYADEWPEPLYYRDRPAGNHTKLEPFLDSDEAHKAATEKAVARFSTRKERVEKKGHMTIVTKEDVAPPEGEVSLTSEGLIYRPLWCVEGIHGVLIIDAYNRKILELDYYRRKPGETKAGE